MQPMELDRPTEAPESSGRLLTAEDITPELTGRAAEVSRMPQIVNWKLCFMICGCVDPLV